jgi:predicted RNA binding protein YcfA (HicA-like mRNA interferase family)
MRAFERAGFRIIRQGKHIIMSNGRRMLAIPRHNPIKAFTLGGIIKDAGLTIDEFRALL